MPITVISAGTSLGSGGGAAGAASQLDANGTTLDVDAISDGQALVRSGTSVVSAAYTTIVSEANVRTALAAATAAVAVNSQAITGAASIATGLGAEGTPSQTFTGDTNTGLFSPGADRVALSAGGTQRFEVSTSAIISTLPISNALGAVGAPAYSFTGDLNTGFYSPGADQVSLALGGVQRTAWAADGSTSVLNSSNQGTNDRQEHDLVSYVQTTDGSATTIASIAIPNDVSVFIHAYVHGQVAAGAGGDAGGYMVNCNAKATGGAASLVGTAAITNSGENNAAWNCTVAASGGNININVVGAAATTINWKCVIVTKSMLISTATH